MNGSNTDTLVILSSVNRQYFSKVNTTFGCVIIHEDTRIFITDFRYYGYVSKVLEDWEVICIKPEALYEKINEQLTRLNAEVVGYEDKSLSVEKFQRLYSACSAFRFEPASAYIAQMRAIKSEEEIQKIAAAQMISQKALGKVVPMIKPGVTEREVAANILYEMLMLGAEDKAFDPIVAFGENSAIPHYRTGKRKLEKNDMVLIDMGAKVDGYCSDMTRTFCVGQPGEKMAEIHNVVLEAQNYALQNIRAGISCHEADSYAREYIISHGYGKVFGHPAGHGIGLEIHELPRVQYDESVTLQPNMIITVEPGVYIDGFGGVRIEDIIVVKEDGILNLTNFDKNINL
ncbi:MAG: aminopeptidase P family protein [Clostridia bacterium]|nr:aminopeptidase P family protein [Clostridia bacterium]